MAKVKQRASCLPGKSPGHRVGDAAAWPHPHDCREALAPPGSRGSPGHGSGAGRGATCPVQPGRGLSSPRVKASEEGLGHLCGRFCVGRPVRSHRVQWQEGRRSPCLRPSTWEQGRVPGSCCSTARHAATSSSVSDTSPQIHHTLAFWLLTNPLPVFDAHLRGSAVTLSPLDVCCPSGPQRCSHV